MDFLQAIAPTTREWATLTLFAALMALTIWKGNGAKAFGGVLRAMVQPSLLVIFALYAAAVTAAVWLTSYVGLWQPVMLKDTIVWAMAVGLPLTMSVMDSKVFKVFLGGAAKKALGFGAVASLYLSLLTFSYGFELLLQAWLFIVGALSVMAHHKDEYRPIRFLFDFLLTATVLWMVIRTGLSIADGLDVVSPIRTFLALVTLTALLMPWTYVLGLIANAEKTIKMVTFFSEKRHDRRPRITVHLAYLLFVAPRFSHASHFLGRWWTELADAPDWSAARAIIKRFKESERDKVAK